jgi:hypothetical protein
MASAASAKLATAGYAKLPLCREILLNKLLVSRVLQALAEADSH